MKRAVQRCVAIMSRKEAIRPTTLIILVSLFFVLCDNIAFFRNVLMVFPFSFENILFLCSLAVGCTALLVFLLTLVTSKWTIRPVLLLLLLLTSCSAYFMDTYNVVIDDEMIRNILATDRAEVSDLLNWKIALYVLILGVLPGLFVCRVKLASAPLRRTVAGKMMTAFCSFALVVVMVFVSGRHYVSFFREHKPLRYYSNPSYYLYSAGNFARKALSADETEITVLGQDARVAKAPWATRGRQRLVVLVVGEAARADHFSLNGYKRKTNPLLEKEDIINLGEVYSCGTSTAYSVPCMFSHRGRDEYSPRNGQLEENVLDILHRTDAVKVLWRDNNSDSKGVAVRIPYEDFKMPANNPVCADSECRDVGMLSGLDRYIAGSQGENLLIVLHQMGNHGPAYHKRYPKEFARFQPVCETNQLEKCSREEITNAYDNALLYTDYFLSEVISFLKEYESSYDTAMLYFSDHGESLGENGIYLHGLPYGFAPDVQKHIGSFIWLGEGMRDAPNLKRLQSQKDLRYSHDNLFHTLLGIYNVETALYDRSFDLLSGPVAAERLLSYNAYNAKRRKEKGGESDDNGGWFGN